MAYHVYISVAGEDRISTFTMDPGTGRLTFQRDHAVEGGPAPLTMSPGKEFLYAGLRSSCHIASFHIDRGTGGLSPIGKVSLESDPCYLSTDRRGRFLLSAYYRAGRAAVHPIGEDGAARGPAIEWLSTAERAHCIQTDPSNGFVFVPHPLGSNVIFQFRFNERTGALTPNAVPKVFAEEGLGPRHFCFHPKKEVLYFSNEQGSSVTAYHSEAGALTAFQTVGTLPEGFAGSNTCAQIHITPSGRFVYTSNRGHDSIAGFSIDEATGGLTSVGQQPTEQTPRAFTIDPTGGFLFAAGQGSGRLASYRIDQRTGALTPLEVYPAGRNPMWVLIADLSG